MRKIPANWNSKQIFYNTPMISAHFHAYGEWDHNRVFRTVCPDKSFGLKFIPNQSHLFRNLFPRQSELIRVNPRKVFNQSIKNQSVSIRVTPRHQSFNPNESEVGILRIDLDSVFRLNHSDLGFIWIKIKRILVKIKNLGLRRINL